MDEKRTIYVVAWDGDDNVLAIKRKFAPKGAVYCGMVAVKGVEVASLWTMKEISQQVSAEAMHYVINQIMNRVKNG